MQIVALKMLARIIFLTASLFIVCVLVVKNLSPYLFLVIPFILLQVVALFRFQQKIVKEFNQFIESVKYRDFTRNFDEKNTPAELKILRQGFNQVNTTFKNISKEKETQNQYIRKILELVNTGILSFEEQDGDVIWMNDTLRNMLQLPHLKKIQALQKRNEALYKEIINLQPGLSNVLVVKSERDTLNILVSATGFQTEGKKYKLIAFQNVSEALDENEAKAWQKLLSVLTHEIMNSIAPISSLADTLLHRLQKPGHSTLTTGVTDDLILGIDTIKKRSEGLLKFAQTYRTLNTINAPNVKTILLRELFESLYQLMQPTLQQKNIELEMILKEPDLQLEADANLVEQVLINLLVNGIEAVKDKAYPKISIAGFSSSGKVIIKVTDNGTGMNDEILDKIFIPFFSTKKNGSGIGLSLCKQIMLLHHGQIQVHTTAGQGSSFVLTFGNTHTST